MLETDSEAWGKAQEPDFTKAPGDANECGWGPDTLDTDELFSPEIFVPRQMSWHHFLKRQLPIFASFSHEHTESNETKTVLISFSEQM